MWYMYLLHIWWCMHDTWWYTCFLTGLVHMYVVTYMLHITYMLYMTDTHLTCVTQQTHVWDHVYDKNESLTCSNICNTFYLCVTCVLFYVCHMCDSYMCVSFWLSLWYICLGSVLRKLCLDIFLDHQLLLYGLLSFSFEGFSTQWKLHNMCHSWLLVA